MEHLVPYLYCIFRACLSYGYIPMAWRQVRMTFILKPRKSDHTEAKVYRFISLSSFLLKTMENVVDRHIRKSALKKYSLHRNQHAYQIGKSTKTALHNVVTHIKSVTKYKECSLT
jgi:hypothetical protein